MTLTSPEENAFVTVLLGPLEYYMGATQPSASPEPAGNWQWVTGEPFVYSNWNANEPNNLGGDEDSGSIYGYTPPQGFWNDGNGNTARPYVVEYDVPRGPQCIPAISEWGMLALALAVMIAGTLFLRGRATRLYSPAREHSRQPRRGYPRKVLVCMRHAPLYLLLLPMPLHVCPAAAGESRDIFIEAESVCGFCPSPTCTCPCSCPGVDPSIMCRSNASCERTLYSLAGQEANHVLQTQIPNDATYQITARYSNDNYGPAETVAILIDGTLVGVFDALDTFAPTDPCKGSLSPFPPACQGCARNSFVETSSIARVRLAPGPHELGITVEGVDGFGVEIDSLSFACVAPCCGNSSCEPGAHALRFQRHCNLKLRTWRASWNLTCG